MHMSDTLISPAVGAVMYAVSAGAIAYSVKKIKKDDLCEKKIPLMGLMGAFVFAAQMINFTIPGTGSSGHIAGGILLAAMIGCYPALLSMAAVLTVQCLFFADGGLLALGCNIFNMAVIPCLVIYPLVFKPLVKGGLAMGSISIASIAAVVAGLQLGAFGVALQTSFSGIAELPFAAFASLMQPIHFAIGLAEGAITAAILCFVYAMRPRNILVMFAVLALLTGGVLSQFASSYPDGLEWAIEKTTGTAWLEAQASAMETAITGVIGSVLAFLLAGACGLAIYSTTLKKVSKGSL